MAGVHVGSRAEAIVGLTPPAQRSATSPPLLISAYVYPPDSEIGGWRPFRFKKFLERVGRDVAVFCSTPQPEMFLQDSSIHRIPAQIPGSTAKSWKSYVDLALALGVFYDSGFLWVPRARRHASEWIQRTGTRPVLFSTSPPIHTHFLALSLKKRHGLPWIADFRDPMTSNPGRKRRHTRHFDGYFERLFAKNADIIITNTDASAAFWKSRYPAYASKVRMLWNGFDPDDFTDVPAPPPRDFKLISHVGEVYADRDPLYMLRGLRRLIDAGRVNPVSLRIAFHGMVPDAIAGDETFVHLRNTGCIEHHPQAPNKSQSETIMRSSDMLLVVDFMEPARLQVPAKVFFYVRTGRPVIACTLTNSPAERILGKSGVPSMCLHADDSEDAIDGKLLEALSFQSGSYTPNDWFFEHFDASRQAATLAGWMDELSAK